MSTMDLPIAAGAPPDWVLSPSSSEMAQDHRSSMVRARFFRGPDPRKDALGNQIVNAAGEIPIVEMVAIENLNDPKNSPTIQISTDIHRYKMFPREYAAFAAGAQMEETGTPLRTWLGENSLTERLATWHIHTVEQLAGLADNVCQSVGPGTYQLRERAKNYLAIHRDSAAAEKLASENATLKNQMAEMKGAFDRLAAAVASQNRQALTTDEVRPHPAETMPAEPREGATSFADRFPEMDAALTASHPAVQPNSAEPNPAAETPQPRRPGRPRREA